MYNCVCGVVLSLKKGNNFSNLKCNLLFPPWLTSSPLYCTDFWQFSGYRIEFHENCIENSRSAYIESYRYRIENSVFCIEISIELKLRYRPSPSLYSLQPSSCTIRLIANFFTEKCVNFQRLFIATHR